jgi:hypothetical protein
MTKFRGHVLRITTLAILPMAASLCQAQTFGKDTFTAKMRDVPMPPMERVALWGKP